MEYIVRAATEDGPFLQRAFSASDAMTLLEATAALFGAAAISIERSDGTPVSHPELERQRALDLLNGAGAG